MYSTLTALFLFFLIASLYFERLFVKLLSIGRVLWSVLISSFPLSFLLLDIFNYLSGYCLESIFDSLASFGTGFEELHAILLGSLFSLFFAYYPLVVHVSFISKQYFLHVWLCMSVYLTDPVPDVVKTFLTCRVVC